jgi:hypothetical protein
MGQHGLSGLPGARTSDTMKTAARHIQLRGQFRLFTGFPLSSRLDNRQNQSICTLLYMFLSVNGEARPGKNRDCDERRKTKVYIMYKILIMNNKIIELQAFK